MLKHIYFGQYSEQDVQEMGIEAYTHNGNYYEFCLTVNLEDGYVQLKDSCEHLVPIDMEHYSEVIEAMTIASELTAIKHQVDYLENVLDFNGRTAIGLGSGSEVD